MAVTPAIPASQIVSINPSVLSAGGNALDLNGLILTEDTRPPIGQVLEFANASDVGAYFGPATHLASLATIYFLGFDNSNVKPGKLMIAQWPVSAVGAYLRGGNVSGLSLTQLQAITGTLSITIDGVVKSGSVDLAAAISFSNAATIIATALTIPGQVTYDSVSGAFVVASGTTGDTSTVAYATGTAAAALKLTLATGAVLSQGSAAQTASEFMEGVIAITTNWASFTTDWEPTDQLKQDLASWTNSRGNRYLYAMEDSGAANLAAGGPAPAVAAIRNADYSGVAMIYSDRDADPNSGQLATFLLGAIASIDFTQLDGRATLAFKKQSGLPPHILNGTVAQQLEEYDLNYYGSWTTANDDFTFFYQGEVTGDFLWIDSYINQIWLNNQLQLALMVLLTSVRSIPYNSAGYATIEAAAKDPIFQGLDFGAIRPGVTLSMSQRAQVNNSVGLASAADTLERVGWYFQVRDALPQVRAARGSPPCSLWYVDGQSVHRIDLASIQVQ